MSTAWPGVRDKCRDLGVEFDEWQDGAGRLILAKRADGKLAAMVGGVGMSLPRQVGKTYLIGALLFALAILRPGLLIIWTAHHLRTSAETFLAMQGFARRRKILPYVQSVYKGSGDEAIIFRNGSRILFGARERGFGRGIPGVDVLMCDEAQILTERALDNMLATLNTSTLGLAIYVGTPPRPEDPSESFARMRADALSATATDLVWIEYGADPGASPDDRKQWAKANPSYPTRTPAESILRLRKKLSEDSFMREALGVWDERGSLIITQSLWATLKDVHSAPAGRVAFAIEMSPERRVSINVGGRRSDGKAHGEITGRDGVLDTNLTPEAAPKRLVELVDEWGPVAVMIDPAAPAGSLIPALEKAGLKVTNEPKPGTREVLVKMTATETAQACGAFFDLANNDGLRHPDQTPANDAVAGAKRRDRGDGAFTWSRKTSLVDISPAVGMSNAIYGFNVYGLEDDDYDPLDSIA